MPGWVHLEKTLSPFSLRSALFSQLPLPLSRFARCPVVLISLKIWNQFRKQFGLSGGSVLTSVYQNCSFEPSTNDPAFRIWHNNGIKSVKNLYKDNIFSSFEQLSTTYNQTVLQKLC